MKQANGLTKEQESDFKEAFNNIDKQQTGLIPTNSLGMALRSCGFNPTQQEVDLYVDKYNFTEIIRIDVFMELLGDLMKDIDPEEDLTEAFRVFDNGNGLVSEADLRRAMMNLLEQPTDEEVDEMMKEAEVDADGNIHYTDLVHKIFDKKK